MSNDTNDGEPSEGTDAGTDTGGSGTGATGGQGAAGGQSATGGQAGTGGQTGATTDRQATAGSDLEPNVAGALCYVLGWISGLFFFFTEEEDEFVRFHAAQSIVVFGALSVGYFVLTRILWSMLFSAGNFGAWQLINTINTLLILVGLVLWVGLMYVAYQGRWYELPIAGELANNMIQDSDVTVERKSVSD